MPQHSHVDSYFADIGYQETDPPEAVGSAVDRYFAQTQAGTVQEQRPGFWSRSLAWIQNADRIARVLSQPNEAFRVLYGASHGDPESIQDLARVAQLAPGVVEGGLADPVAGILGFPGALIGTDELPTDKLADWIQRRSAGFTTFAEQIAMDAGLPEDQIAASHSLGNFIGFAAPISASMKLASLTLRTGQTIGQVAAHGAYLTDFTAGLIYGGLMREGDAKQRLGYMLEEAAAFGVMRTLIMAAGPLKTLRHKRARDMDAAGWVEAHIRRMENGEPIFVSDADEIVGERGVLELLNQENYIAHSAGAQEILMRQEYDAAVVQAILDVQGVRGNSGLVRGVGHNWPDVTARVDRLKEQFPGMKFEPLKHGDSFDVFFGPRGLNNTQRAAYKKYGRFPGQVLRYGSGEVKFLKPASREGWIQVIGERKGKPHVFEVKAENVTDLPVVDHTPDNMLEFDRLGRDFIDFVDQKQRETIRARGGLTEADLIRMVREGAIDLSETQRRAFEGTALIHVEEFGLTGDDLIAGIALQADNAVISSYSGPIVAQVTRNSRRGAMSKFGSHVPTDEPGVWRQLDHEGEWRITYFDPQDMSPLGHQTFENIEHALQQAEEYGLDIVDVTRKIPDGPGAARLISETGTEYANILEPMPTMTMDEAWGHWARDRGLDLDAVDALSAKKYMVEKARRQLWNEVDPADRAIFDEIVEEHFSLTAAQDFTLEQLAAVRGFHVSRLEGGIVKLRQIDTGLTFQFGSEVMSRKALQRIVRPEKDLPSLFEGTLHGMSDWSRGLPKSETIRFEDMVISLEDMRRIPMHFFRNNRDWLMAVEQQTGLPVWSKGFDPIQQGYVKLLSDYEPWARQIQKAWKGINLKRRTAIAEFWVRAEREGMSIADAVKTMKAEGFSTREINALRRSRAMFDHWFGLSGIDRSRYIEMYYTRVRPFVEKNGTVDLRRIFGEDIRPSELNFWAEYTRQGDMAVMEMDPEMVMHKYIRTLYFQKHVKQHWDELARIVGTSTSPPMKFRDLPDGLRQQAMRQQLPGTTLDSPVLPDEVRKVLSEYLMVIRGQTHHTTVMTREFTKKLFNKLKIDADERTIEELVNSWISMQYGAAMGLRPSVVARNMTQTLWLLYTRLGSKNIGKALELSMTREGYEEAIRAGVIPLQEAGLPMGEVIQEAIMSRSPKAISGEAGLAGYSASFVLGGLQRVGNLGKKASRSLLHWYGGSDQASRAWSYFAQKLHTDEWLTKFEAGRISWETFQEKGLPFFADPSITKFEEIYNRLGREEALQYIGRLASDEANFIYGLGAQPAWMQTMPGRLVGMFGTWPMWAIETYFRRSRQATLAQSVALYARTTALIGAFVNMGLQTGIDMWSWIAPASMFGWFGGPAAEHAVNLKRVVDAPMDQRAGAFKRMAKDMSRLAIPGQVFFNDAMRAVNLSTHNPSLGMLSLLVGRPYDNVHIGLDYLYNPDTPYAAPNLTPETEQAIYGEEADWYHTFKFLEGEDPSSTRESASVSEDSFDEEQFGRIMELLGGQ